METTKEVKQELVQAYLETNEINTIPNESILTTSNPITAEPVVIVKPEIPDERTKTPPLPRKDGFADNEPSVCTRQECACNTQGGQIVGEIFNIIPGDATQQTGNGAPIVNVEPTFPTMPTRLEDAQHCLEMQKKRSASAVRMLKSSLNILQKNIEEVLGITEDDLGDTSLPKPPDVIISQTIEQDNTKEQEAAAKTEAEIQRLQSKLKLLERRTNEGFKTLEARRETLLLEIKQSNAAMSELFAMLQKVKPTKKQDKSDPNKEVINGKDDNGDYDDSVLLPFECLQLKQDWVESLDESVDWTDYEAMVAAETDLKTPDCTPEHVPGESAATTVTPDNYDGKPTASPENGSLTPAAVPVLKKHQRDDTKPGFTCKCGIAFKANGPLWHHIVQQTPPRFKCDTCGKLFHVSSELKNHTLKEHNIIIPTEFTCYVCNSKFSTRSEHLKHRSKCAVQVACKDELKAKRARVITPTES